MMKMMRMKKTDIIEDANESDETQDLGVNVIKK